MVEDNLMHWIACLVFLTPLKHRSYYPQRAAVSLVSAFCILELLKMTGGQETRTLIGMAVMLGVRLVICTMFMWFCGAMPLHVAVYCSIWTVMICQSAYEVRYILYATLRLTEGPLFVAWMAAVYIILLGILGNWVAWSLPEKGSYDISMRQMLASLAVLAIFEYLFAILIRTGRYEPEKILYFWLVFLMQGNCVLVLHLQNALFKTSAMKQEMLTLNRLWYQQKAQYELAEEAVTLINHKCHDLKHQIAAMRMTDDREQQKEYMQQIEDSIQIYESMVKTGNRTLDTILTEKRLQCAAGEIKIHCIADGCSLKILEPVDLYTIFGNALDNAVEYVKTLDTPEMRIIDVRVYKRRQFLLIHIMNPLQEQLDFENGIPVSTKPKNGYHGYGIKSIIHTVEKYNGFVKIETRNQIFSLDIMIPISETE